MIPALVLLAVLAVAVSQGFGQSQAAPAFEVASIRLPPTGSSGPPTADRLERVRLRQQTLLWMCCLRSLSMCSS